MDKELLNKAIEAIELLDIHLYSCSVKREELPEFDHAGKLHEQSRLNMSANFYGLDKNPDNEGTDKAKRIIAAKITFGHRFLDDNGTTLAEIEASFIATYEQKNHVSDAAINEFLTHNVVHNVWPFWREHSFRITTEARLPRPSIGLRKSKTDEHSTKQ